MQPSTRSVAFGDRPMTNLQDLGAGFESGRTDVMLHLVSRGNLFAKLRGALFRSPCTKLA
jgi:hypothetical protein